MNSENENSETTDSTASTVITNGGVVERLKTYWSFTRPFTLVAPALGMASGGLTALGADLHAGRSFSSDWTDSGWLIAGYIILGILMASALNAASNGINQIYDLAVDRINKPERHLPAGTMTMKEAWVVTIVFYIFALWAAYAINIQCFVIVVIGAVMTYIYSAPPFRTKRWGVAANMTIAIPRGVLLKVAGWSTVKTIAIWEPWYIGLVFGAFLLGASTTKDFSDMKGDEMEGCITLPIKYGVKKAAYLISPSFVVPFLMISLGAQAGWLTGNVMILTVVGIGLAAYGCYVLYLMLRKPEELAATENHISWKHMYIMMFATQIGFAVSYLL